jgi:hypothetical protein
MILNLFINQNNSKYKKRGPAIVNWFAVYLSESVISGTYAPSGTFYFQYVTINR